MAWARRSSGFGRGVRGRLRRAARAQPRTGVGVGARTYRPRPAYRGPSRTISYGGYRGPSQQQRRARVVAQQRARRVRRQQVAQRRSQIRRRLRGRTPTARRTILRNALRTPPRKRSQLQRVAVGRFKRIQARKKALGGVGGFRLKGQTRGPKLSASRAAKVTQRQEAIKQAIARNPNLRGYVSGRPFYGANRAGKPFAVPKGFYYRGTAQGIKRGEGRLATALSPFVEPNPVKWLTQERGPIAAFTQGPAVLAAGIEASSKVTRAGQVIALSKLAGISGKDAQRLIGKTKVVSDVLANAGRDVSDLGAQAIPSAYLTGAAAFEAAKGRPKRANQLIKGFKETDALYGLATKGPGEFVKRAGKHPVYTAAELYGGKGALGKGLGRVARGRLAPRAVREYAEVTGPARRVEGNLGGAAGDLRPRRYSRDLIANRRQKNQERLQRRLAKRRYAKARKLEEKYGRTGDPLVARKATVTRQLARKRDPDIVREADVTRAEANFQGGARTEIRKAGRETKRELAKIGGESRGRLRRRNRQENKARRQVRNVVSMVAQRIAQGDTAPLRGYLGDLTKERKVLQEAADNGEPGAIDKLAANERSRGLIRGVLEKESKGKLLDVTAAERVARQLIPLSEQLDLELANRGIAPASRLERASLIPSARRLGAWYDRGTGRKGTDVEALDQQTARAARQKVGKETRKAQTRLEQARRGVSAAGAKGSVDEQVVAAARASGRETFRGQEASRNYDRKRFDEDAKVVEIRKTLRKYDRERGNLTRRIKAYVKGNEPQKADALRPARAIAKRRAEQAKATLAQRMRTIAKQAETSRTEAPQVRRQADQAAVESRPLDAKRQKKLATLNAEVEHPALAKMMQDLGRKETLKRAKERGPQAEAAVRRFLAERDAQDAAFAREEKLLSEGKPAADPEMRRLVERDQLRRQAEGLAAEGRLGRAPERDLARMERARGAESGARAERKAAKRTGVAGARDERRAAERQLREAKIREAAARRREAEVPPAMETGIRKPIPMSEQQAGAQLREGLATSERLRVAQERARRAGDKEGAAQLGAEARQAEYRIRVARRRLRGVGRPVTTAEMRADLEAQGTPGAAFVTENPEGPASSDFARSYDTRGGALQTPFARTGDAAVQGTADFTWDKLVASYSRRAIVATSDRIYSKWGDTFGYRLRNPETGELSDTIWTGRDVLEAGKIARDASIDSGQKWVVVRNNPLGSPKARMDKFVAESGQVADPTDTPVVEAIERGLAKTEQDWNEVRTSRGPFMVVLAAARDEQWAQLQAVRNIGNAGKVWQQVLQTWRRAVLFTSTRWALGNVLEGTFRLALARAGPTSYLTGRRTLKELEKLDPYSRSMAQAMWLDGGHYGFAKTSGYTTRRADQFRPGERFYLSAQRAGKLAATKPGRGALRFWEEYTNYVGGGMQAIVENPMRLALLGKEVRRGILENRRYGPVITSKRFMRVSKAAVADASKGLSGTPMQIEMARLIDRQYGQYGRFTAGQRKIIAYYTPFLAWTRNAAIFLLKVLPQDYPEALLAIAVMDQTTEELRKQYGATSWPNEPTGGAKRLPDWLQGSVPDIFGGKGRFRAARYTPFGLAADPAGTAASAVLPFLTDPLAQLRGSDWKGKSTGKTGFEAVGAGFLSFMGSLIPFYNVTKTTIQKGPGTAFNPLTATKPPGARGSKSATQQIDKALSGGARGGGQLSPADLSKIDKAVRDAGGFQAKAARVRRPLRPGGRLRRNSADPYSYRERKQRSQQYQRAREYRKRYGIDPYYYRMFGKPRAKSRARRDREIGASELWGGSASPQEIWPGYRTPRGQTFRPPKARPRRGKLRLGSGRWPYDYPQTQIRPGKAGDRKKRYKRLGKAGYRPIGFD